MNLKEAILRCNNYEDTDDITHTVFAMKIDGRFEPGSEAVILKLTAEEMEVRFVDIANTRCPGYEYFLEMFILQDVFEDIEKSNEYGSDLERVKAVIHYAEFDA